MTTTLNRILARTTHPVNQHAVVVKPVPSDCVSGAKQLQHKVVRLLHVAI